MKKLLIIAAFLPLFSFAQKPYLQVGAGYLFKNVSINSAANADLSVGIKIHKIFNIGVGASYSNFQNNYINHSYIPVYADIKIIAPGIVKPYAFIQPGYGFYKSDQIIYTDYSGQEVGNGYITGGFYSNFGVGVLYKIVYLQVGYRTMTFTHDTYEKGWKENFSMIGITGGIMIP